MAVVAGGLRFDAYPPNQQMQLLDRHWLAANPLDAFTSNNVQPPLWNFVVGGVTRWSPFPFGISMQMLFLAAGLATVLMLWSLLRGLGSAGWVATVSATLVGWSPLLIRNESALWYETFETTIITASALAFLRWRQDPKPWRMAALSTTLVTGVLTRTTLTPLWIVGGIAIALVAGRARPDLRTVVVSIGALACVFVPLAHRAIAYDTVGFSSFSGMNLERISVLTLPRDRLEAMIHSGQLSPSARVVPFRDYAEYEPYFGPCRPGAGNPVVAEITKRDGTPNFNSICYRPVDRQAMRDAVNAIRLDPGNYVHAVRNSTTLFSSWGIHNTSGTPTGLRVWTAAYAPLTLPVHIGYSWGDGDPQQAMLLFDPLIGVYDFSLTVAFSLLLCGYYGVRGCVRWLRHDSDIADETRVFIAFTVFSLAIVSVLFDTIENARFREPLDPLLLGPVYALVLTQLASSLRRFRRTSVDDPPR